MAEQEVFITMAGLRKLQEDLTYLKTVRRKEAAASLRNAIFAGGTWENPDYEISKMELAYIEKQIQTLENLLGNAKVIDGQETSTDKVRVGHMVSIQDMNTGEEMEFMIVGPAGSRSCCQQDFLSLPCCPSALGPQGGELVQVDVLAGQFVYKITAIGSKRL